jgi:hypothetical protein
MKIKAVYLNTAFILAFLLSGCAGLPKSVVETDLGDAETIVKDRIKQHVYTLASDELRGRRAGSEDARKAADYIAGQFEEIGIEPYFENTYLQPFKGNFFSNGYKFKAGNHQNVAGIIRGNDPVLKDEYIVVGAHYDAIGVIFGKINNGADDNASGTAALIELARELKRSQSDLGRSIILIAFDAEEWGLFGSVRYIFDPQAPLEKIKLMIGVDMVGYYQAEGTVYYMGSGTMQRGDEVILNPEIIPEGLNVTTKKFESSPFSGTDTWSFAFRKIPTLMVHTGTKKSAYHTSGDDADLIDYNGMTLITEHLKNVVVTFSQDADYKSTGKLAQKHKIRELMRYGVAANIGDTHYRYTTGGTEKSGFSFGAGLMSQLNLGIFGIRPEVYYDYIRAGHPAGTTVTNNITVPFSFVLQTPKQFFTEMDLFAGGYYLYRFDGKQGSRALDFENAFNRHEAGITFGWGIYIKPFRIGQVWRVGLTDFTRFVNANNAHIRNTTFYTTITYTF